MVAGYKVVEQDILNPSPLLGSLILLEDPPKPYLVTLGSMDHRIYDPQQAAVSLTRRESVQLSPNQSSIESSLPFLEGIQKCPLEVLTEIFLDYLEDRGRQIYHLLFVSKHWYRLIIHTSIFWTRITIVITSPHAKPTVASQLCYIKAFIERSRDTLLDIEVESSGNKSTYAPDTWQNYSLIVSLLRDSMHRWRTLHITLPSDFNLSVILFGLCNGSPPNLVNLSVENFKYRADQLVSFPALPSLRSLEIDVYPFEYMVNKVHSVPLTRLRSLDLDLNGFMMSFARCKLGDWTSSVSLLRSLHSLQLRTTGGVAEVRHKEFKPDPISLPLLHHLGLWRLGDLRVQFYLPTLRALTFDGGYLPKVDPMEVIWRPERKTSRESSGIDRDLMKAIILRYPSAKLFVIPNWAEDALAGALRVMEGEGSVPNSSVSFMEESSDGTRKPMKTDSLISRQCTME